MTLIQAYSVKVKFLAGKMQNLCPVNIYSIMINKLRYFRYVWRLTQIILCVKPAYKYLDKTLKYNFVFIYRHRDIYLDFLWRQRFVYPIFGILLLECSHYLTLADVDTLDFDIKWQTCNIRTSNVHWTSLKCTYIVPVYCKCIFIFVSWNKSIVGLLIVNKVIS